MNQWMITRVTSEFQIASCGIGFDLPALAAVGSGFRIHCSLPFECSLDNEQLFICIPLVLR